MAKVKGKLTIKQARFAEAYLVHGNAARAYIEAGYKNNNNDGVRSNAIKVLKLPQVAALVAAGQKRLANKYEITRERLCAEYAKIAFSDPRQVAEWGPSGVVLRSSKDLTDDAAACVAEVSSVVGEAVSTKFKLHDKKGALDSLAKITGHWVDRSEVDLKVSDLAERMKEARLRAKGGGGS